MCGMCVGEGCVGLSVYRNVGGMCVWGHVCGVVCVFVCVFACCWWLLDYFLAF